jgi:hypothetical protein
MEAFTLRLTARESGNQDAQFPARPQHKQESPQ